MVRTRYLPFGRALDLTILPEGFAWHVASLAPSRWRCTRPSAAPLPKERRQSRRHSHLEGLKCARSAVASLDGVVEAPGEVARLKVAEGSLTLVLGQRGTRERTGRPLQPAGLPDAPVRRKSLFSTVAKDAQSLTLTEHEAYGNGIQKMVVDVSRAEGS